MPKMEKTQTLSLPLDTISNILLFLPPKSLTRFKSISKSLYILISSPQFIKTHLTITSTKSNLTFIRFCFQTLPSEPRQHCCFVSIVMSEANSHFRLTGPTKLPSPSKAITRRYPTKILGSCHGLVLLKHNEIDIALWNPFIKRYKKLPFCSIDNCWQISSFGFGYDSVSDDYKVVRIVKIVANHKVGTQVWIFSLKLNSWRRFEILPCQEEFYVVGGGSGVFLDGKLHWLCGVNENMMVRRIVVFELGEEMLYMLPQTLPMEIQMGVLEAVNGCLCVTTARLDDSGLDYNIELYALKKADDDDGGGVRWSRLHSISVGYISEVKYGLWKHLAMSKKGDEVLLDDCQDVFWYDLVNKRVERMDMHGGGGGSRQTPGDIYNSVICCESLLSPGDDSGFDGAIVA